jgi:hypothetical protein
MILGENGSTSPPPFWVRIPRQRVKGLNGNGLLGIFGQRRRLANFPMRRLMRLGPIGRDDEASRGRSDRIGFRSLEGRRAHKGNGARYPVTKRMRFDVNISYAGFVIFDAEVEGRDCPNMQGLCMASAFTLTLAYLGEQCSAMDATVCWIFLWPR